MGIEQASSQQMSVIASLAASEGLDQVLRSDFEGKTDVDNSLEVQESVLKRALGKEKSKVSTQILAALVSKLSQTLPADEILQNLSQEYQFVLNPEKKPSDDLVVIRRPEDREYYKTDRQENKQNLGGEEKGQVLDGEEGESRGIRPAIREYIGAYSQMLVSGGAELKKKVEQLESQLMKEGGISAKELQGVKLQAAGSIRSDILKQVKREYLKQLVTGTKTIEGMVARKGLNNVIDFAFFNDRLGGYDFGGVGEHLQGAVDRATKETREEMKDFVKEKLTQALTQKELGEDNKKIEEDIDDLLRLSKKVGFDLNGYLSQLPKIKDDLGILPLLHFEEPAAAAGGGGGSENRGNHNYQYSQEEEKEVLTDKLRAIFLHRALYGDMRSVLRTQFKMVRTKNGLLRLGVKNFDEVKKEGEALAKVRLFQMLQEAFEERATYAKLTDSAWKMTEKKLKTVVRNLENLGISLSQTELDAIRDKANAKMYQEAEHELSIVNAGIAIRGEMKYYTAQRKKLQEIMVRLAAESHLGRPGQELGVVKEAA